MVQPLSASQIAWAAARSPAHGLRTASGAFVCATCASAVGAVVPLTEIETPTTSAHADLFRHSRDGVCEACAWLFMAGKGRPGNYVATPSKIEYTVISLESVVADKPPWLPVLRGLSGLPDDTPVCGVMTTDVKPRLFHKTRAATIGAFGLYIHAPDYDVSAWRSFNLRECLTVIDAMMPALRRGFAKRALYFGLLTDFARASADLEAAMRIESSLAGLRENPAFLPALIAAGVTKEDKKDVKRNRPDSEPSTVAAERDQADKSQLGLF